MVTRAQEGCISCDNTSKNLLLLTNKINKAIIRIKSEHELFAEICKLTVEVGNHAVCWIGQPDKENNKFNAIAHYNATKEDEYQLGSRRYDPNGPTATVIRTGKFYLTNNFKDEVWDEELRNYLWQKGFRSYLALPISKQGKVEYTLNLYSGNVNFFSDEQIQFLEGISDDISYAIDNIENEKQKTIAHDQLREISSLLQRTESATKTGSWKVNFATGAAYCSDETFRIYGIPPNSINPNYNDWAKQIHPEDKEAVIAIDNESRKKLRDTIKEYRIINPDGTLKYVQTHAHYELDTNGQPIGMYGLVRDITAETEAEAALAQSEKNLRLMVDLIPQSIFIKDLNGNFIYANKSYCDLYGKTVEEINNSNWSNVTSAHVDRDKIINHDNEIIRSGTSKKMIDFPFTDHSGKERYFDVIKTPFQLPGKTMAILCILNEITERKHTDILKSELLNDLTERNKNLEQFSYIISHNLRAPLANILGICKLLTHAENRKENTEIFLEDLTLSAEKLDNIVRDLSTIMQAKQSSLPKEAIRLDQIVADVKHSLENMDDFHRMEIKHDFGHAQEIYSVKSFIFSIFHNLIANSIKYSRPDIAPILEIRSRHTKNGCEIIFSDNGTGIDMAVNGSKLFGLYNRFDTSKEGSGIGLYIVKTQVEALHGQIEVSSEVNVGTTFKINIKQ